MRMIAPEINTSRLKLRAYTEADVQELVSLIGDREVAKTTLRIAHPYTEEHARDFIRNQACTNATVWLAITSYEDRRLCGGVGLRIEPDHDHAELGYWIGVPFWGHGYATEAARAMMEFGFESLNLHRIVATVFKGNEASDRILLKLGMKHEGCMREHLQKWGEFIDVECYGILRSEWEAQHSQRRA